MPRRVYAGAWPRIRRAVLTRDGYLCQIRARGCTTVATDVDHIVPVAEGGQWWDESNLRAACGHCNTQRIGQQRSQRWRSALTYITLVVGPSGVDLLAHVRTHAQPGDLVVDHGALAASLGGQDEAARSLRTALIERLRKGEVKAARAWITSTNPNAEALYPHHRAVVVDGEAAALSTGGGGAVGSSGATASWRAARRGEHATAGASRAW